MNKFAREGTWRVGARIIAALTTVMLSSMTVLPGLAQAVDIVTFSSDTSIVMTGTSNLAITVKSGSAADTFTVNPTTIVMTVASGNTVTLSVPGKQQLNNDKNISECNVVSGANVVHFIGDTGPKSFTITPSLTVCGSGAGGGGGGGGGGAAAAPAPTCKVIAPNGGETLKAGDVKDLTWSASGGNITNAILSYSVDGGKTWGTIDSGISTSTSFNNVYKWKVPNTATTSAKVRAECRDASGSSIKTDDSDSVFTIAGSSATPATPPPANLPAGVFARTEANAKLPAAAQADALVKLPTSSAVYYVGLDAKRHPFPNSQMYASWYPDFSKVQTIDAATMASITLGKPILGRPGMYWVKIQSDPKTYYVEPNGYVLRWIKDEATAKLLGGANWNKGIIDVEPTYFTKYKMGADITEASLAISWPNGALLKKPGDTTTWYSTGTSRRAFSTDAALKANEFQSKYVLSSSAAGWQALPVGAPITGLEDALFSLENL